MELYSSEFLYVSSAEQLQQVKTTISQASLLSIDTETTGLDPFSDKLRLLQIGIIGKPVFLIDLFSFEDTSLLKNLFQNDSTKIFHNGKFDLKFLKTSGLGMKGPFFDSMLAYQVLTAGTYRNASLKEVCFELLGIELEKEEQVSDWSIPDLSESQLKYAANDVSVLFPLFKTLREKLADQNLADTAQLEFEALEPTVEIEFNGMLLDSSKLEKLRVQAEKQIEKLRDEVRKELNAPDINLNSPKQVKEALVSKGIEVKSTSKSALVPLVGDYPVLSKLLRYRKEFKLNTSFLSSLPCHVHPITGRIHPTLWQLGAVTGRYSCSNPNLQQIPRESKVRVCFIVPPGKKLVIADFSQIELRVVAELTQDKKMLDAFNNGEDLHSLTASLVCQKPIDQVSADERTKAKAINFGLTFGMSVFALKNYTLINYGLEMSWWQAWQFHNRFFDAYSALKEWHQIEKEKISTECFTMSGRRRSFPEESWFTVRLNTPVQGTAADIMKKSLTILFERLNGTETKIIGTVHDEILLEALENEALETAMILEDSMKKGGEFYLKSVPVEVDIKIGMNWGAK
jgi:DNA polymerase I